MTTIWTKAFWTAAIERSAKTFAQALLGSLSADGLAPWDIDWRWHFAGAGMAAFYSLLSSVASAPVSGAGPSLTSETIQPIHRDEEMIL